MLRKKATTTHLRPITKHTSLVFFIIWTSTCILVTNAAPVAKIFSQQQQLQQQQRQQQEQQQQSHQQLTGSGNSQVDEPPDSDSSLNTNNQNQNIIETEQYTQIVANDCQVVEQTLNKLNDLLEQAFRQHPSSSSLKVHVIRTLSVSNGTTTVPTCLINVDMGQGNTYGFNFAILVKLLRYVSLNYDNWLHGYDNNDHEHEQQGGDEEAASEGGSNTLFTNLVSTLNFRCQGRADSDDDYPYARHATLRIDRASNSLIKSMYGSLMTSDLNGCESAGDQNEFDRLEIGLYLSTCMLIFCILIK